MKKFSKNKIALFLAFASIFSGKSQAMETKCHQTLAAVGGEATKNKGFVNWVKNHKLGVGIGGVLTATTTAALIFLGIKYWGKKESGSGPNKSNKPTENKDIPKKNIEDPEKIKERKKVKEDNEKIINCAIGNAKVPPEDDEYDFGPALENDEDEKQSRANIKKLEDLVSNNKNWFATNFSEYSQKKYGDTNFDQNTSDWAEANKLFSFNDNIYNKLSGVFSGDIKLSYFTVSDTFYFEFEFDNSNSITVDFSKKRSTLRIEYKNRNFKENEITSYSFEFKNLGSGFLSEL